MKYFSMFSGIGGFELGIQRAFDNRQTTDNKRGSTEVIPERMSDIERKYVERPISCVGYSEIDKYAIKVYERNFNGHTNYGNATAIDAQQLPDFDLLVGGFPCQAFSIAGKRYGFQDTRGTLFFDIARILANKRPRHLVLENVKGLLSHDNGKTFQTILGVLTDLGYTVEWQVLNSKDFGVPQNRERIIIVGHLRGECSGEVFPITGNDRQTFESNKIIVSRKQRTETSLQNISSTLTSHYRGSPDGDGRPGIIQLNQPTHSNDRVYGTAGVSPTLNTMQGGNRQPFVKIKKNGEPKASQAIAATLTGGGHSGGNHSDMDLLKFENSRIRRLTPKECERLQGFPDDWTKYGEDEHGMRVDISDTQRYKMCGNAVTTNVIQAVMERLANHEVL